MVIRYKAELKNIRKVHFRYDILECILSHLYCLHLPIRKIILMNRLMPEKLDKDVDCTVLPFIMYKKATKIVN